MDHLEDMCYSHPGFFLGESAQSLEDSLDVAFS